MRGAEAIMNRITYVLLSILLNGCCSYTATDFTPKNASTLIDAKSELDGFTYAARLPESKDWEEYQEAHFCSVPTESNILDLCPGSVGAPMQAPVDPSHIAGTLRWVCPHCRWRVSVAGISPHQAPPYVPMHPLVAGAASASPLAGPAVAVLEST